jgi:hypothetical protein
VLPINGFGQQRLNGAAKWSAGEGGQGFPHFKHIVIGVLTPPCPIPAAFLFLCGQSVGHWSIVGWLSVGPQ